MDCSNKGNYQKQTCYKLKLLLKKKIAVSSDLLCKWSIMCNFKDKIRL